MIDTYHIHPFPKVLRIEPASSCNFKCIHCPTGLDLNSSLGVMSNETFNKIYEKIKRYRFKIIVLYHGGEPLLNVNFFDMVRKLRPLADQIKTVTNGSMLDDLTIDQILDSGIDIIDFSLDGNSPEENDKIRIGSNFKTISENIKKLIIMRDSRKLQKPKIFVCNIQIPENMEQTKNISVPKHLLDTFGEAGQDIHYKLYYSLIWPGMKINIPSFKPESNIVII